MHPEVKAALFDGSTVLKEWTQPCRSDLDEILKAVKHVKQSVNDYLTELIAAEGFTSKDEVELSDVSDGEDDNVSGFIKDISVNEKTKVCEKRKSNCWTKSKRIKK